MNKKHWISVYFNQDVPDEKIKELVRLSYETVVGKMSKKERAMLEVTRPLWGNYGQNTTSLI